MTAEAHGLGWATVLFYGNIDGTPYGDANNPEPAEKLGSWVGLLPLGITSTNHSVGGEFKGSFNRSPKTYSWNASGSIKLVPVYWKWRLSLPFPGGTWEEASSIHHSTKTDSTGGSWTVQRNWTTLNRASPGNRSSSSSSGCANNETYNYCDDQGSCSVGSTSGVPGPVCGHNYCCCSPSSDSGSDSGSDTGSSDTGSSDTGNSGNTATCDAGHSYNPESDSASNRHGTRTCRFSECGQSWQRCQGSAPLCNKPYRNQNGFSCWAE